MDACALVSVYNLPQNLSSARVLRIKLDTKIYAANLMVEFSLPCDIPLARQESPVIARTERTFIVAETSICFLRY